MPVIDDLKFVASSLLAKMNRLDQVASRVEKDPTNKKEIALLKVMSEGIDESFDKYQEAVTKIAAYNAKQTPRIEVDIQSELVKFETLYYNVKAIVSTAFPDNDKLNQSMCTSASSAPCNSAAGGIALPKLRLVEFNGDIKSWTNFADLFTATVHSNTQMSDVQKHMYLRSVLKGEALSLIASLPLTGPNYSVAWSTLQSRYNNTTLLTDTYLDSLLNVNITAHDAESTRALATLLSEYVGALQALGHDVEGWAVPLLFLLRKRLTSKLRENWEKFVINNPMPSIKQFLLFLDEEARVLEASQPHGFRASKSSLQKVTSVNNSRSPRGTNTFVVNTESASANSCLFCQAQHPLARCGQFRHISVSDRLHFVKQKRLCLNCLTGGHFLKDCVKSPACKHCTSRHHTLLHFGDRPASSCSNKSARSIAPAKDEPSPRSQGDVEKNQEVGAFQTNASFSHATVLLATAQAYVQDGTGAYQRVKVLIDSASQGTFITASCAKRLGLTAQRTSVPVFGMAQTALGVANGRVRCQFKPARHLELHVDALIVDTITNCPSMNLTPQHWNHLQGLPLADPCYYFPQPIDILLGAEWFGVVIIGSPIVGPIGAPNAVESIWGYCLLGRVQQPVPELQTFCISFDDSLDKLIRRFWEIEEAPSTCTISREDQECEELYASSVSRLNNGRYIVKLPFLRSTASLGDSRQSALRRFQLLERRLSKNAELRQHYNDFMKDYIAQNHMVLAPPRPCNVELSYFIPHHCIFRQTDKISKFRVVFDASMSTQNGPSLNKLLHTGPKLQADIVNLLISFRIHDVVLVADIRQMYRNIMLHREHHNFQRILWRFSEEESIKEYCLTTVTYGVTSSPFLAIRTLQQLVSDEGAHYPAASQAIRSNTYMDDIVTSVSTLEHALQLQTELIELMARGGFELRKWMSNRIELLESLPAENCAVTAEALAFESESEPSTKILGLIWNPNTDLFTYQVCSKTHAVTKRAILSDIAKLFDPMGFICPVTFVGKCIIQHLWQLGLDWDDAPPVDVCRKWVRFREELPDLSNFSLARNLNIDSAKRIQLHGFADSSEKGYAAVIYLRTEQPNNEIVLSLLVAKSKVAPVQKVSLPRLELCALVLVSKLLHHVAQLLKSQCELDSTTAWTDSMVALRWVQTSPHRWKTYVANRVSQVQTWLSPNQFRHVPSQLNPADCASRGLFPSELLAHPMWIGGPPWLLQDCELWPSAHSEGTTIHEEVATTEARTLALHTAVGRSENVISFTDTIISSTGSLSRLKRIVAWCLRFIKNIKSERERQKGPLTVNELSYALHTCIKWVQKQVFLEDMKLLLANRQATARLRRLCPFIDEEGILRVGGRLRHANLPYANRHPILLPKDHPFTLMLIDYFHKLYLHPGSLNLHAIIQSQYWIIAGREAIRHRLSKCITCFRAKPRPLQPFMGNLPPSRLQATKAFSITEVDYGGPYEITLGRLRKARTYKAYICLFVCFATKAVHLELASELTTEAFLAALRRFIARRGSVKEIHSDCGTNFVGAKRKFAEWEKLTSSTQHVSEVTTYLTDRGITWHLNPPSSPHFGGLWEAGIKSTKNLLSRVIGAQILTYEEFYTVLTQVEATLNSRPLGPLSTDPNDLQVLTPGHFLWLEPPAALNEPLPVDANINRLQRWNLLRQIAASFWKRWSAEYLCSLQQRTKWLQKTPNLTVGTLVIIREENIPPLQWRTGRVLRTFPGADGIVRVAEIKTSSGITTRPVVKLCPLPIE